MATPIRTPQNANNVLILLAAIDANLGRYLTVEKQNEFLDDLVKKYDFEWEGKGKWSDSHETLRRVLNRLAQDRRPEYRDLTGDDKLHDRVHALFRHGSEILSMERLRAYGYNQSSSRSIVDGKRKRTETEAGREYRQSSNSARRRRGNSRDEDDSDAHPVQKRMRTGAGETERNTRSSNGNRRIDARRMSMPEELPRTRRYPAGRKASSVEANGARHDIRSSPQRYGDDDSENGEGSSEYEDAMPHFVERTRVERKASPQKQPYSTRRGISQYQNGNGRHHHREPSPNPWQLNGAMDSWANGDSFQVAQPPSHQDSTQQDLTLCDRIAVLHQKITQLASFFYPPSNNNSLIPSAPQIHATPPPALADLYASIFGSDSKEWHRIAGPLLEHRALPARTFIIALIWAFLRKNFLDTDATGFHQAPLWSLLDENNLTHRWAKGYYQSGIQAASTGDHASRQQQSDTDTAVDAAAWPLMRAFFRKVAHTQLHSDRLFQRNFLQPTAWDAAFALHGLLNLHSTTQPPSENSAAAAAFNSSSSRYHPQSGGLAGVIPESQHAATDTINVGTAAPLAHHPDLPLLCKEICLAALVLRGSVQICTEKFEWLWVESGMEWDDASAGTGAGSGSGSGSGGGRMLAVDAGGLVAVKPPGGGGGEGRNGSTREDVWEREVAVGVTPGLKWVEPLVEEDGDVAGEDEGRISRWEVVPAKVLLMPL
jgi:hypothetical protein